MAAALLLFQPGFQLADIGAAILLLRQEQLDGELGAVLVGGRRALLRQLLGDAQDLRIEPCTDGFDLPGELGAQPQRFALRLGRAGIAPGGGGRRSRRGGAEQPLQQAGFSTGTGQGTPPGARETDSMLPATEK
ncbi:MAG TPA: hypothetical protein VF194_12250 [Ferrovibrio sp.]|jgi:hypothetical protein|uniref:hypothetical protein n=1 Tax=Ferrovibrio sp. TaxID=1917215 RepID=UPI002ED4523B